MIYQILKQRHVELMKITKSANGGKSKSPDTKIPKQAIKISSPTRPENGGQSKSPDMNIPKQAITISSATRPEEVPRMTSRSASPAPIKDFVGDFCKDDPQAACGDFSSEPSEDTDMFGKVNSQNTDRFASLVAGIHAPDPSCHQSFHNITPCGPCFSPNLVDSHPTLAPWDNQYVANVSDDDIRMMWFLQ